MTRGSTPPGLSSLRMSDGTTDDTYLTALQAALGPVFARGKPDLVIYLAGADPYEDDRLGRLKLTKAGLAERDQLVFDKVRQRGLPIAIAMAGGYARNINDTVEIHANTVCTAARHFRARQFASL